MCQIDIKYPVSKAQWLKYIEAGGRALTIPKQKTWYFLVSALKGVEHTLFSPLTLFRPLKSCTILHPSEA